MALLITDDYISNITERLSLYKELDDIQEEEELQRFRLRLIDRFGPVPPQTEELIQTIRLRWLAKDLGFEKIIMKNERLTGYFVANQESPFYRSEKFTRVLKFVQQNPAICRMKEARDRLSLTFIHIDTVSRAIKVMKGILDED
jgi:transcription-repair coupling factor (superfamily II helicase)